jgi:uncharacterized protein (DUF952 family)
LIAAFEAIGYELIDSWQAAELAFKIIGKPEFSAPSYRGSISGLRRKLSVPKVGSWSKPGRDLALIGNATMDLIYKIVPASLWREAQGRGRFTGAPADLADGFIHFSLRAQLEETAAKWFFGQEDLMLIAADPTALGEALRFSPRAAARFFHIFMRICRLMPWFLQNLCLSGLMADMISPSCWNERPLLRCWSL